MALIDGREQHGPVGKELLSILASEYRRGTADRHDEVRFGTIGEGGSDVVDKRLFSRRDKPGRAHHDLDDVLGPFGTLVQFDAEVASKSVDRQAAAVDRLQQQYLTRDRLRFARHRADEQQARQRRTVEADRSPRHLRSDNDSSASAPASAPAQPTGAQIGLNQDDWKKGRDRNKGIGVRLSISTPGSVDEIAKRAKNAGITLKSEPHDTEWKSRAFEVSDPSGFLLTIFSEASA